MNRKYAFQFLGELSIILIQELGSSVNRKYAFQFLGESSIILIEELGSSVNRKYAESMHLLDLLRFIPFIIFATRD